MGKREMMTKLRNHTMSVKPRARGFCFLKLPYLCNRSTLNNSANANSMRSMRGALTLDFPSISHCRVDIVRQLLKFLYLCENYKICLRYYRMWSNYPKACNFATTARWLVGLLDKTASGDGKSEKTQNAEEIKADVHYFQKNKEI